MATNGNTPPYSQPSNSSSKSPVNLISALTQAFKSQAPESYQTDRIATLLLQNMGQLNELAKQGKLNYAQIMQLKEFADKNKNLQFPNSPVAQSSAMGSSEHQPSPSSSSASTSNIPGAMGAYKSSSPAPTLGSHPVAGYPISQTLNTTNPGPVQWMTAQQGRPTLSGGIAGGRISGTPSQVARNPDDVTSLGTNESMSRRKNSPNDQSMRRSIQDLVYSVDPNIKIEAEVEDLLLDIADEFIDSVTNFGCRLAKHRGGESLEVRDLQLHLGQTLLCELAHVADASVERNHNIRIPGFASDETRISISQSVVAPAVAATGTVGSNKKVAQGTHMTLRSQRLAQVAQAKKDAKLM